MDIDYIFQMLRSENPPDVQMHGIKEAEKVRCLTVFIQPLCPELGIGENTWENCAWVLSKRKDKELSPVLHRLVHWLRNPYDLGAETISYRLNQYHLDDRLRHVVELELSLAKKVELEFDDYIHVLEQEVMKGIFLEENLARVQKPPYTRMKELQKGLQWVTLETNGTGVLVPLCCNQDEKGCD